MSKILDCPSCTRKLRLPDDLIGQRVKCPTCGGTFEASPASAASLPRDGASPPPASPPTLPEPPRTDGAFPPPLPSQTPDPTEKLPDASFQQPSAPSPAPDGSAPSPETVPIKLSVDEFDKPGRPAGFNPAPAGAPTEKEREPERESGSNPFDLRQPSTGRREFMRCPYCDERISADARQCRYCGENLDDLDERAMRNRFGLRRDCEPHRATLVLVFGILSIVMNFAIPAIGLFLGIPAWIMGRKDLTKMDSGAMDPSGRGNTQAGYVCGIIGTILGGIYALLCAGYFAFVIVMISATAGAATKSGPVGGQQQQPPINQPNNQRGGGF